MTFSQPFKPATASINKCFFYRLPIKHCLTYLIAIVFRIFRLRLRFVSVSTSFKKYFRTNFIQEIHGRKKVCLISMIKFSLSSKNTMYFYFSHKRFIHWCSYYKPQQYNGLFHCTFANIFYAELQWINMVFYLTVK